MLLIALIFFMESSEIVEAITLSGEWKNELGSNMTIKLKDGYISGTYQTAVVSKGKIPDPSDIHGTYTLVKYGTLFTFNVNWKFEVDDEYKYSITTWIGKFFYEDANKFETTWILLSDNPIDKKWNSYTVNKDFFTRIN